MRQLHTMLVAGCRPNFVKIAPLMSAIAKRRSSMRATLVHTGQHFDDALSDVFFRDLGIRRPDHMLQIEGSSHATQTASMMERLEAVMRQESPDLLLVVGDVNSTLAATLVAVKLGIPVAHVEAGLRSYDREMPEELNRLATDALAEYLFATEPSAVANLLREGRPRHRIFLVGNVMVDTLHAQRERLQRSGILQRLGLEAGGYALMTVHRPGNVDDPTCLAELVDILEELQERLPVVFPAHPRVQRRFDESGLGPRLQRLDRVQLTEPLGYQDFVRLQGDARLVLTDSGGVQEETTALGIPCLTLRDNTERPVTVEQGTNVLVGMDRERVMSVVRQVLNDETCDEPRIPELWDGEAAERIADILVARRDEIAGAHPGLRARELAAEAMVS